MKFIIDDKIPYIEGVLEPFGEVIYLPGSNISREVVKDADALVTRTRTLCNAQLLAGSSVKFIATATIGHDHIDTEFCDKAGIAWANAPGCNSKSVEQYIASALFVTAKQKGFMLSQKTIGIIGVGHVGSKVAHICELFGMKVLLNDPPRERSEGSGKFSSLAELKQHADIITFHVPLNLKGEDATYHFADDSFFHELKHKPIIINSSRGEVLDTSPTITARKTGLISGLVIDCWENEPDMDPELFSLTDLATPHIAGYSKDGKSNGTQMCIQAISSFFGLGIDTWRPDEIEPPLNPIIEIDGLNLREEEILAKAILSTYDIRNDNASLRAMPEFFEYQRGNYQVRREFTSYAIHPTNVNKETIGILKALGFSIDR